MALGDTWPRGGSPGVPAPSRGTGSRIQRGLGRGVAGSWGKGKGKRGRKARSWHRGGLGGSVVAPQSPSEAAPGLRHRRLCAASGRAFVCGQGAPAGPGGSPGPPAKQLGAMAENLKKKQHQQNQILSIFIAGEMDASGRRRSRGEPGSSGAARGELFPQRSRSCIIRPHGQRRQVGGGGLLGGCGHWPGGHRTPRGSVASGGGGLVAGPRFGTIGQPQARPEPAASPRCSPAPCQLQVVPKNPAAGCGCQWVWVIWGRSLGRVWVFLGSWAPLAAGPGETPSVP